ncbi:hypothetical protein OC846_004200 [Tilletia horrida]|uniref:Uncharacterized protein n=1 Tax=Tilletia horrida TaxID=155126 RepID=A0AAN6JX83_9BASI|nr:hypothetical protein OC846_004200 [Tilletia horrida]KAK0564501.1 hypothetical protein OC861_004245 [Tilletia horrida]
MAFVPPPFPIPNPFEHWQAGHPNDDNMPGGFDVVPLEEVHLHDQFHVPTQQSRFLLAGYNIVRYYSEQAPAWFWGNGVVACNRARLLAHNAIDNGPVDIDIWNIWHNIFLSTVAWRSSMLNVTCGAWWGVGGHAMAEQLWNAIRNGDGMLHDLWVNAQNGVVGRGPYGGPPLVFGVLVRHPHPDDDEEADEDDLNVGVLFNAAFNPLHALRILQALEQSEAGWAQGVKPLLSSLPRTKTLDGEWGIIYSRVDFT